MTKRRTTWPRRAIGLAALVLTVAGMMMAARSLPGAWRRPRRSLENVPTATVRRTDVKISVRAAGQVESAQQTEIECELENLQYRSRGSTLSAGGSAFITYVIPDGTMVKEGDILCTLDSSDYEELVRQQKMKVEEERAETLAAAMDLEVAEVALREYEEGMSRQIIKDFEGRIALAESEIARAKDRLAWSRRMLDKGYVPLGQVANEEVALQRAELTLLQTRGQYDNYLKFGLPKMLQLLRSDIEAYKFLHNSEREGLERHEERLAHYRSQVEACTIRAPHDGFVIYDNERDNDPRIEVGAWVRQKQDLFLLPDLSRMEVLTPLHESVVDRIEPGMTARVRVEALPQAILEGHVVSINRVPYMNRSWRSSNEVKYYLSRVKLDSVPRGLRPGMSAEVEIVTGHREGALVVPATAVRMEEGREVCYVAGADGLERREVSTRPATPDLLEVAEGLAEGEEVVLEPIRLEGPDGAIAGAVGPDAIASPPVAAIQ